MFYKRSYFRVNSVTARELVLRTNDPPITVEKSDVKHFIKAYKISVLIIGKNLNFTRGDTCLAYPATCGAHSYRLYTAF